MLYMGERRWPRRSTPSRSAREDPWAPSDVDQAASLIMSPHERDRLTRDHRDLEIALFLLCKERLDALISLTEANTLLLRTYLPGRVGMTCPFRGQEGVFDAVEDTTAMTCWSRPSSTCM